MPKTLVIMPTYNEAGCLPLALQKALSLSVFDALVVDDNSTDGTADIAAKFAEENPRVHLMRRPGKLGLGTAYIEGFKWGLSRGYDLFIEMDSDLSHNPCDLPRFVAEMEKGYGLVIGSRYMGGKINVVGWDFRRLLLSRFGNFYASCILGAPITDMTSGFRCFTRAALESIDLNGIHSEGYAFQIEMAYRVYKSGLKVAEMPIVFSERYSGSSKMSKEIIREAVWLPWKLRFGGGAGGKKGAL